MSFLSKVELKRHLQQLGIKVEGNYVRKKDIVKILAVSTKPKVGDIVQVGKDHAMEDEIGRIEELEKDTAIVSFYIAKKHFNDFHTCDINNLKLVFRDTGRRWTKDTDYD